MLASNFAAISGSIEIMISFFCAIRAFLSSTCSCTHSLKSAPITAAQTFMIHCFGTFGRSGSSGKYRSICGFWLMYSITHSSVKFLYCGTWMFLTWSLCKYAFLLAKISFRK